MQFEVVDELLYAIACVAMPVRPRLGTQRLVTLEEDVVGPTVGKASTADTQVLHQTKVFHLDGRETGNVRG
jgi:hypothetical protein